MLFNIFKRFNVVSAAGTALAGALIALALLFAPQAALATVATPLSLTTNHWRQGGTHGAPITEGYTVTATVSVPDTLAGLPDMTLTGAQLASPVVLTPDTLGTTYSVTADLSGRPSGTYTVNVVYPPNPDNPIAPEALSLQVTAVLDSFATLTSPDWGVQGIAAPTFTWQAPAAGTLPTGGVDGYQVSLSGVTATPWVSAKLTPATLSTTYSGTGLASGYTYPWSVYTFDAYGNSAENRDGLVMIGANISGKVTDFSGNPIAGAAVTVYLTSTPVAPSTFIPSVTTRADGSYFLGGFTATNYYLKYSKGGRTVYYNNRLDAWGNKYDNTVNYSLLKTGVDAKLTGWGAISGNVVNSSATGVPGVTVQLLDANGQATSYPSATTVAGGAFTFSLIAPGIYKIRVIGTSGYATLDYPNSVAVSDGAISTLPGNAVLQKINITGTVTNSLNAPVSGVFVWVYKTASTFPESVYAVTGQDGTYALAGLVANTAYRVFFDSGTTYAKQYYNRKATLDAADIITVVDGTVKTGVDAVLGSGKPTVTAFTVPATSSSRTVSGITFTASEPTYGVAGYMITESASAPSATDTGWKSAAPTSYTVSGVGDITLYAWAKGASGLVSDSVARTVTVTASAVTPGDSDGNGIITISEVKLALDMYIGVQPSAYFVDTDNNGSVSLQEVQKVINAFLAQP